MAQQVPLTGQGVLTLPSDATQYLDGTGNFSKPTGTAQVGPRPSFGIWGLATPAISGTSWNTSGYADMATLVPSGVGSTTGSTNPTATEPFYIFATTSTAGNTSGGGAQNSAFLTPGIVSCLQFKVKISGTSNIRVWIGFTDVSGGGTTLSSSDAPASCNLIGFRFSSTTDSVWKAVALKSGASITVVSGTMPAPDTSLHTYQILFDGTTYSFWIDGVQYATILASDTNMPVNTTQMRPIMWTDNKNSTTSSTISMAATYWELRM